MMTQEEYLDSDGTICPYCGSIDIEAGHFNGEAPSQIVECHSCGKTWRDIYKLVAYEEV